MILPEHHAPTCRTFIARMLEGLPDSFQRALAFRYSNTFSEHRQATEQLKQITGRNVADTAVFSANTELRETVEKIDKKQFRYWDSDQSIRDEAETRATGSRRIKSLQGQLDYCKAFNVEPPDLKKCSIDGIRQRLVCPMWWRRRLRKRVALSLESVAIELNIVHDKSQIYCSDPTLNRRRQQRYRNEKLLETLEAMNSKGFCTTIADLCSRNPSNPAVRRAELMVRIRGFEDLAERAGHAAMFYTWTAPSRMHATHKRNGERNRKYDGTKPSETGRYFARIWQQARSELHRKGCSIYGFRVTEAHHDATPHWHLLLFMPKWQRRRVTRIMEQYAKKEDAHELGSPDAHKARFDAKPLGGIDPKTGKLRSATGYIAKYIAKNIDGFKLDYDEHGTPGKLAAERIEAWATTWSIRQFQQIGGPSVTIWRELRKLKRPAGGGPDCLYAAWLAADAGDWAGFVVAMGGPVTARKNQTIKIRKTTVGDKGRYCEAVNRIGALVAHWPDGRQFYVPVKAITEKWEISLKQQSLFGDAEADILQIPRRREDLLEKPYETTAQTAANDNDYNDTGYFLDFNGKPIPLQEVKKITHAQQDHHSHVVLFLRERFLLTPWSSVNNYTGEKQYDINGIHKSYRTGQPAQTRNRADDREFAFIDESPAANPPDNDDYREYERFACGYG